MTMLIGKTVVNHLRNQDDDDGDSGGGEMKQKIMSAFMFRDDDNGRDNNHDNDYVLHSQVRQVPGRDAPRLRLAGTKAKGLRRPGDSSDKGRKGYCRGYRMMCRHLGFRFSAP